MIASVATWAVIDGVGLPEVGWSTGWVLVLFFAVQFVRGKVLTEGDHQERMRILTTAHAAAIVAKDREIDRIEHDRQEWRTESRIKDARDVEKDLQIAEQNKQLAAVTEIGHTLETVLTAISPHSGGPQ